MLTHAHARTLTPSQARTLLLFTQHVRHVSVYYLPPDAKDPAKDVKELFSVSKHPAMYIRRHAVSLDVPAPLAKSSPKDQEFAQQSAILKAAADCVTRIKDCGGKENMGGERVV